MQWEFVVCICFAIFTVGQCFIFWLLIRRYQWPLWLCMNLALALVSNALLSGSIALWGVKIDFGTRTDVTSILSMLGAFLVFGAGIWLQRERMLRELDAFDGEFLERLEIVSRILAKGRRGNLYEDARLHKIPQPVVKAASDCYYAVGGGIEQATGEHP